jgi:hypothetical protein
LASCISSSSDWRLISVELLLPWPIHSHPSCLPASMMRG